MSNTMSKYKVFCSKTIHATRFSTFHLMSEVENEIDCLLIELILSVTYLCLEGFFTLYKIDL